MSSALRRGAAAGLRTGSAARVAGFQAGETGSEGFQLLARVREHFALHLEFLAGDEIEPGEQPVQQRQGVLFQVLCRSAGGYFGEAGGEIVKDLGLSMAGSRWRCD